jgi:hypothetical protein
MDGRQALDKQLGDQLLRGMNMREQPDTVADRLRQLDCDPIAEMAKLAQDETVPVVLRARMLTELTKYIAPRAKAEHLTGADGGSLEPEYPFNTDALRTHELQSIHDLIREAGTRR